MDWSSALNVIEKLAPTISAAIGGPLAGGAVSALEQVFGLTPSPESSSSDRQGNLAAAIAGATPDQLLAMKKADQDYAVQMATLGFKDAESIAALVVQDRESARNREMVVKDKTPATLAYMIIGGFFTVSVAQLVSLMGYGDAAAKIPPQGWLLIGNISGYLASEAKAASAYYFGTTQGSDKKTDLLAEANK